MAPPAVSFFTAGNQIPHNGSYIISNQAYVQYIPPVDISKSDPSKAVPLLFIHGGGLTGHMWETTPDRRPGWAVVASQPLYNRPVYLIDAVDSGRSQRCPDTVRSDGSIEHRTALEVWERFRIGDEKGFHREPKVPFRDSQFPAEHFDALVTVQSARRRSQAQNEAEISGVAAALREIGPCQVIAHSNGGAVICGALRRDETLRSLVRALVLVEPGPPVDNVIDVGVVKTMIVTGDYLDGRFQRMCGILQQYKSQIQNHTLLDLPAKGINGNTHFPMCDRNSDAIANIILRWLGEANHLDDGKAN